MSTISPHRHLSIQYFKELRLISQSTLQRYEIISELPNLISIFLKLFCGGSWTRTNELYTRRELQSLAIATMRYPHLWSWRDSNPRPDKETKSLIHKLSLFFLTNKIDTLLHCSIINVPNRFKVHLVSTSFTFFLSTHDVCG